LAFAPKLRIREAMSRPEHRSGWAFALAALEPLCTPNGLLTDTFTEATFGWRLAETRRDGTIPYKEPWLAFLHNPPGIPEWHEYYSAPQVLLQSEAWLASAPQCVGIVTFSQWMANWLRARTSFEVVALVHPTEVPEIRFDWSRYEANPDPKIVQIGWWLRRLHSIYQLPVRTLRRAMLQPVGDDKIQEFRRILAREAQHVDLSTCDKAGVVELPYRDNDAFDNLLAENLVFVDLYDSVCNNTLIECIVRNTPVLVNPLPSVVEYLGPEYPLYFDGLNDAARKADDRRRVLAAHRYLEAMPKDQFSAGYFRRSLAESALYRRL
jgi:hypothetical protein